MCGTLAQLVEQRTFNPLVTGSTPVRPTKFFEGQAVMVCPSFLLACQYAIPLAITPISAAWFSGDSEKFTSSWDRSVPDANAAVW
jgi:hypothetical protein